MNRRNFLSQATAAFAGLSLLKPGEAQAGGDLPVYFISDGKDNVVSPGEPFIIGSVRLGAVSKEFFEAIDDMRRKIQADLGCKHCAILWDGPLDSITGSCSPHWDLWPEYLKAGLPFKVTMGKCVNVASYRGAD
jgi:hypothetical protein